MANFPILSGVQSAYDAITTKDPGILYLVTDSRRIYLGSTLIADSVTLGKTIRDVDFDEDTQTFTFTYTDDTTHEVDLVLESVIQDIGYDTDTKILTFTLVGGSTTDIDLTDLVDAYTVANTNSITMSIAAGEITAELKLNPAADNQASVNMAMTYHVLPSGALQPFISGGGDGTSNYNELLSEMVNEVIEQILTQTWGTF